MLVIILNILKQLVFILLLTFANNVCFVLVARYRKIRITRKKVLERLEEKIARLTKERDGFNEKLTGKFSIISDNQEAI